MLIWTQVDDLKKGWGNEAVQRYSIQAIPPNFLVDPTGKIVATNLRGAELLAQSPALAFPPRYQQPPTSASKVGG